MSTEQPSRLVLDQPRYPVAGSRSRLYALLVEALSYPEGGIALRLLDGDWRGEAGEVCADLAHASKLFNADAVIDAYPTVDALKSAYSTLFGVGSGAPAVSMLERRYSDTPEQKLWERLLAFYTHFGLDFSHGYAAEQPDHLLTELSFMHYLTYLEAGATASVDDLRRGQRDFLAEHLARLTDGLREVVAGFDHAGLYGWILTSMADFIAAERTHCEHAVGSGT